MSSEVSFKLELLRLINVVVTDQIDECCICSEKDDQIYIISKCQSGEHSDKIHLECLWKWFLLSGDSCPICRQSYEKEKKLLLTLCPLVKNKNIDLVAEELERNFDIFDLSMLLYLDNEKIIDVSLKAINLSIFEKPENSSVLSFLGSFPRLIYFLETTEKDETKENIINILYTMISLHNYEFYQSYISFFILLLDCKSYSLLISIRSLLIKLAKLTETTKNMIYHHFEKIILSNHSPNILSVFIHFHLRMNVTIDHIENIVEHIIQNGEDNHYFNILVKFARKGIWKEEWNQRVIEKTIKRIDGNQNIFLELNLIFNLSKNPVFQKQLLNIFINQNSDIQANILFIFSQKITNKSIIFISLLLCEKDNCDILLENKELPKKLIEYYDNFDIRVFDTIFLQLCYSKKSTEIIISYLLEFSNYNNKILEIVHGIFLGIDRNFLTIDDKLIFNISNSDVNTISTVCQIMMFFYEVDKSFFKKFIQVEALKIMISKIYEIRKFENTEQILEDIEELLFKIRGSLSRTDKIRLLEQLIFLREDSNNNLEDSFFNKLQTIRKNINIF